MKKYKLSDIKKAFKIHNQTKFYKGYKCQAHNNALHDDKCDCESFVRVEDSAPKGYAKSQIQYRLANKLPLHGFNDKNQKDWTY